ncbi:hypothetical protein Tco_1516556 [Tanacetum coccineum]
MGSNEEIIQLLQKTQMIFKQTQRDKEEKYLNDIIQLQDKIKDLENVVCKMGRSTDTLRLLTSEQKAFKDNLHKSGVGYNGPFVLSQAYAKIPKLYRASELCDKNEQLHVFDSEETLDEAFKNSVKILETKSMPSESPLIKELYNIKVGFEKLSLLIKQNSKRASIIFYTSKAEIERNDFCQEKVKPLLNELQVYLDAFQDLFHRDIKEMKDAFEQNDVYLDEIENQNDLLKDQLLEASLTEDIKNLVITSCVEIRNKDLHDEIERISKKSKDVSNESKTVDTACNDAFEVKQELSKRIVELEKHLSKSEAKGIAFEIALQHKSRDNNSLKIVQKENENFMASLQLGNDHLKQTYKDLFESVQRSKVEIKQCDEAKVKDDFDNIETRNIELEYRVASLIKENEHLKLTYKNLFDSIKKSRVQTKTSNVTQDEAENLKSQLFEFAETKFKNILEKIEFFKKKQLDISIFYRGESLLPKKKQLDISELNMESGKNVCDNAKCEFLTKFVELEKVLTQQTKDFNDVKLELSNRTTKFEAYFEKLEKTKVVLERQLACKFDKHSILGKPPADKLLINSQISKSWFTPKVDEQKSLSKPVTTQSLPKNVKDQLLKRIAYLESKLESQDIRSCQKEYHELRTSYNALKVKFDSLNLKIWNINVSKSSKPKESVSEKVHTDRKFSKKSQTFETSSSHKGFKTSTFKGKNHVFVTPHSRFTPVKQVWRPKQSHSKSFKYSKSEMLSMQNKNDFASTINKKGRVSNETNFQDVSSNDINKWKSSSSTRFKTPFETPSFKNQWNIKRNFKSPLIPRELFSNETPVSSPRWNSTSLHRLDTTFNWFSKFGKPVSTVLKWVPKVVV